MAKKFLTSLDLAKNELQNAAIQNLSGAPSSPVKGQIYMNTSDNTLYWWDGAQWIAAKAAAGATPAGTVTTQAVGDAGVVGVSTNFAREDHKHGREAFGAITAQTTFGAASGNGGAATLARSDHVHGTPTHDNAAHSAITLASLSSPFGVITAATTFGIAKGDGAGTTAARNDHTHGTPAHSAAEHSTITLNSFAAPVSAVSMNGQKLTSLGTPTAGTDAVTKDYTDNLVAGLSPKEAVRAATVATGTLASAFQNGATIDGVVLATGNRILVKDQSTATENGIYTVNASGAPTRATDADAVGELEGAFVFAMEGTVNADKAFICATNAPITPGSTATTWVLYGAGSAIAAGAGLTGTSTFDVGAGTGITVAADTVGLDTAYLNTNYVPAARTVSTTAPLTGGGALSGNLTLAASTFTSGAAGVVPASGGVAANFLSADGTWKAPPAGTTLKVAADCAAAATTTVNHNLNTYDVEVTCFTNSGVRDDVEIDVERPSVNSVLVRFLGTTPSPPTAGQYRIVVIG